MATKGVRNKKVEQTEAKVVLDSVKDLDLPTVVNEVGGLQVMVQGALAKLSTDLTTKIQQMEQVEQAIVIKQTRLKELFDIENEAVSLDDMRAQHAAEVEAHDKAMEEKALDWKEEQNARDKRWKREAEDHEYNTRMTQQRVKEEFDAEVARAKRAEQMRQEALNKSWAERENELKAKEQEFVSLKEQVAGFDAKLKAEVAKAEQIVANTLKRQNEHEIQLLKKDIEAERSLHQTKVGAMDDTINNLQEQIKTLQDQLTSARNDAKEVATQAFQSVSGQAVSAALTKVVDTSGRDSGKK
jgi:chromosome segregation ATPase